MGAGLPIGTIQFPSNLDGGDTDYGLGDIAINPMGSRLYVLNTIYRTTLPTYTRLDNTVEVIDTAQNTVTKTIDLAGTAPRAIAINPAGTRLYVADDRGDTEVIDTASNQVITRIDIPVDFPLIGDIQVTADGVYLFMTVDVSTGGPDLIYIFDTATNTIAATIELPPDTAPGRMASFITVDDGQVPLSNFSSASLILQTPVIQVPGFGGYNASLVLSDPANLELTLTDVSGTGFQTGSPALFSFDTGILTIPVLGIDGRAFFEVDLALVPDPGSLRFRVTRAAPLP